MQPIYEILRKYIILCCSVLFYDDCRTRYSFLTANIVGRQRWLVCFGLHSKTVYQNGWTYSHTTW